MNEEEKTERIPFTNIQTVEIPIFTQTPPIVHIERDSDASFFIHNVSMLLLDKKSSYQTRREQHLDSLRKNKFIYYVLGNIASISSIAVSFLTGVNTIQNLNVFVVTALGLSLLTSIVNNILSFSDITKKVTEHFDAYNKYDELIVQLTQYLLKKNTFEDADKFITALNEKELLIKQYEQQSCCFSNYSIQQTKQLDKKKSCFDLKNLA